MSKLIEGWRNKNSNISYPLKEISTFSTDILLDACFFLDPPVTLTKIVRDVDYILFFINDGIYWQYPVSEPYPDYIYNDYGKLVVQNIDQFLSWPIGNEESYSAEFLESVCYGDHTLSIMDLTGDVILSAEIEREGQNLVLYLPETTTFVYGGISHINEELIINGSLQITGDACTQVIMRDGLVAIDDVCLPPCYDCNGRLTTGDVHLLMTELEAKVDALENP